jgi:hypothetical protein
MIVVEGIFIVIVNKIFTCLLSALPLPSQVDQYSQEVSLINTKFLCSIARRGGKEEEERKRKGGQTKYS